MFAFLGMGLVAALPRAACAADDFKLQDGDQVVWLGNTLIEREQRYAYWETALTRRYPDKNITFRNLGWSGDTVFGEARAGFGSRAEGFRRLKEHALSLKPTVIIIGYGFNESFEGQAGLTRFQDGLNALLNSLAPTKARVVLLSPLRQENLGPPLPDPGRQNENIRLYSEVLRKIAAQRGDLFVDLCQMLDDGTKAEPSLLTDNGIHLTAYGYWRATGALEQGLGLAPMPWRIDVDAKGKTTVQGAGVAKLQLSPLTFQATDAVLPVPQPPEQSPSREPLPGTDRVLRIRGLPAGNYALTIEGTSVATATAAEWAVGVKLERGPEFDQEQRLRQAIVEKNDLYFHRWRPQNETYLFGFRKYEQGQNAREIPQFDPLVARKEAEIAKLRSPAPRRYELVKQADRGK
jgi:lysophospholipase L1-like esterase